METFMREFIRHTNKLLEVDNIWLLEQEFTDLRDVSNELGLSCEIGKKLENRRKNRYRDILPFDDTRVTLPQLPNDPDSDYINANLVRGATAQHHSYIASQGPLRHTLGDFWRMLFSYNIKIIVMLCNEREGDKPKCERYWPTTSDQPSMVIDVFDVSKDAEFLDSVSRTHSASSDSTWAAGAKSDAASAVFEQRMAEGVGEDQSEMCVSMHFELKLVKEWDTQESYTMRKIRATKFETVIVWDNPEPSKPTANGAADCGNQTEAEPNAAFYENVEFRHGAKRSSKQIHKTETRDFLQFHYRNWADYAAADELGSIFSMLEVLRRHQPSVTAQLCVHCSAGCGRTGTILFIDYVKTLVKRGLLDRFLIRKAKAPNHAASASSRSLSEAEAKDTARTSTDYDFERSVEDFVRRIVLEFRKQRPAAVQSFEQYVMCYRATSEIFRKQLALIDDHAYVNLEKLRNKQVKAPELSTSVNTPAVAVQNGNDCAQVPTTSNTLMSVSTITLACASSSKSIMLDWCAPTQKRTDFLSVALDKLVQGSSVSSHLDQIDTITCKNTSITQGVSAEEACKSPQVATKVPVVTVTQNASANANENTNVIGDSVRERKRSNQPPRSRTPDPERSVPLRNADSNSANNFRDRRTSKDDSFLPQMRIANQKKPGASLVRHLGELKLPVRK